MKKKRIRICGRKTRTLPAPAMTPSTSRLRSGPTAMCAAVQSPTAAMPFLIASMGRFAHEKTAWNIRKRTTASRTRPSTGCITTASMRCWNRCSDMAPGATAAMMRRTSRCRSADDGASAEAAAALVAAPRAAALDGDGLDDRAPELGGEPRDVDRQPLRACDVGHVERDHQRPAEALQLE